MAIYIEPAAGETPVVQLVASAQHTVDLNVYELTDRAVEAALVAAGKRGVRVRILLEPHPMGAQTIANRTLTWCQTFSAEVTCTTQQGFGYDHAKYIVADGREVEIGSANFTYSGLNRDRDYLFETDNPATANALETVFNADWTGSPNWEAARQQLVLSPGALPAMQALLTQSGAVDIESEEYGGVKEIAEALLSKGGQARLLLPTSVSSQDREEAAALSARGVQVRYLSSPYLHAKLILTPTMAFIGSENLSWQSLNCNREAGVVLTETASIQELQNQFNQDWAQATP